MAEKKLRILQINSVYGYGSTGRIVRSLHHALMDQGFESSVIFSRQSAIGRKSSSDYSSEPGVYFIHHPVEEKLDLCTSVLFDTNGLHSANNTRAIIRKIRELQPDVIHLHNLHGFYLNVPMLFQFLKQYGKPVLWTLHDCWSYTGFCAYYDYHQCGRWQTGCRRCPYRDTYPYRLFSHSADNMEWKRQAYAGLNMTLAVPSQWLRNELSKSILKDYSCVVIPNSIDTSAFSYENNDLREVYHLGMKRVYLACASVWTVPKGFREIQNLSRMMNENEVLVVIGLTEKQKRQFSGNTVLFSRMDGPSLRKWYSTADCFVNLTLEDNYPTVNLEARACGLPVVTYQTGGSPESAGNSRMTAKRGDYKHVLDLLRQAERQKEPIMPLPSDMCSRYIELYQKL